VPVVTWIYRILDESNVWLSATKMEGMGRLVDATLLYLKDATESLRIGSPARAGLSCTCAADCLSDLGAGSLARKLYLKSATIYRRSADTHTTGSIREWLWSLQKSYENFLSAGDAASAESAYGEYALLAKRVDPLIRELDRPMPRLDPRDRGDARSAKGLPDELTAAVDRFLETDTGQAGKEGSGGREDASAQRG
jgi:hypothetical protein